MNKLKLIMLIGPPGCGKSTWLEERDIDRDQFFVASTDDIVERLSAVEGLTYDQGFKRFIKVAEKEMKAGVLNAVENSVSIIWDQTNLTAKSRAKKLNMIPAKYSKEAVYFVVKEDTLRKRLNHRAKKEGKTIPEHILRSMLSNFEEPKLDEGFDVIHKKMEF